MSRDNRQALVIQRAICFLIAIAGILLLWASTSHAAISAIPTLQATTAGFTPETVIPDPGTWIMLTAGITCVFVKLRGAVV